MKTFFLTFGVAYLATTSNAALGSLEDPRIFERGVSDAATVSTYKSLHRAGAVRFASAGGAKWDYATVGFIVPHFSPASTAKDDAWFGGAYTGIDVIEVPGQDSAGGVEAGVGLVVTRNPKGQLTRLVSPYIFYGSSSKIPNIAVRVGDEIVVFVLVDSPRNVTVIIQNITTRKVVGTVVHPASDIIGNTVSWTFSSSADSVNVTDFASFSLTQAETAANSGNTGTQGAHPVELYRNGKKLVTGTITSNTTIKITHAGA